MTVKNAFGQSINTIYQNILADFCNYQLNEKLFDNECTDLKFNTKFKIAVNTDSTLWTIKPFIIVNYFDSSLITTKTSEMDSITRNCFFDYVTIRNLIIDFRKDSILEKTNITIAPKETTDRKYLLRLSSPKKWNNYLYIELWIKYNYYSSGTRLIYKIDHLGRVVEIKKYNLCDDNG